MRSRRLSAHAPRMPRLCISTSITRYSWEAVQAEPRTGCGLRGLVCEEAAFVSEQARPLGLASSDDDVVGTTGSSVSHRRARVANGGAEDVAGVGDAAIV